MTSLNKFMYFSLTKASMASIVGSGGGCVCSNYTDANNNRIVHCGAASFSQQEAYQLSVKIQAEHGNSTYSYDNACGNYCVGYNQNPT